MGNAGIRRDKVRYYFLLQAGSVGFMTVGHIRCRSWNVGGFIFYSPIRYSYDDVMMTCLTLFLSHTLHNNSVHSLGYFENHLLYTACTTTILKKLFMHIYICRFNSLRLTLLLYISVNFHSFNHTFHYEEIIQNVRINTEYCKRVKIT